MPEGSNKRFKMPEGELNKGEEIILTGGKYGGQKGWKNKSKKATALKQPICVVIEDGEEIWTSVFKIFVKKYNAPNPRCRVELTLDKNRDIIVDLESAARKLAACDIHADSEVHRIAEMLKFSIVEAHKNLCAQGSKGKWRRIIHVQEDV